MAEAIRVLHVFGATNLGGAESRVMDLYRAIDKSKVQFDFVVHTDKECYFDKEIIEMGGRIFRVPPFRVYNIFSYKRAFRELFKEHSEFKVVHGHMTSTASIYLPIAKKAGVRTTIAHARSAGVDKGVKGKITTCLRRNLHKKADYLFACSKLAGEVVFGNRRVHEGKVYIIPNAINAECFRYNGVVREKIKEELGITNRYVIGHVGSFRYAKNHEYLLKVMAAIIQLNQQKEKLCNPVLLLLGDGQLIDEMKDESKHLGLEGQVFFLGNRRDIWKYYQAFDYVIFPSRYEGMPGTIVEAQAAGVRCLMSNKIAEDTIYTDLVDVKSIDYEPIEWAKTVLEKALYVRKDYYEQAQKAGFDVCKQAEELQLFYENGEWKR